MKVITIGRSSDNDICIQDSLVSRTHCQIIQDDNGYFTVIDTNSKNGTYVNGIMRNGAVRINKSDIIRIGNTTLPWQSYFSGSAYGTRATSNGQYVNVNVNVAGAPGSNAGNLVNNPGNSGAWTPPHTYIRLSTDRSLLKFVLLNIITLGIYGIVVLSNISNDINTIAQRYDNKHTMHYCLIVFLLSWLTLGIASLVWFHRLSERIGSEQVRRGLEHKMSAETFWGWYFLGSFIIVGPFIYMHKLLHSMNDLCADYNMRGC